MSVSPLGTPVVWTTSNPAVAVVSTSGIVTGTVADLDTVTVTATAGTATASARVWVAHPVADAEAAAGNFCSIQEIAFVLSTGVSIPDDSARCRLVKAGISAIRLNPAVSWAPHGVFSWLFLERGMNELSAVNAGSSGGSGKAMISWDIVDPTRAGTFDAKIMGVLLGYIVHEADHAKGGLHSCGNGQQDRSVADLRGWGKQVEVLQAEASMTAMSQPTSSALTANADGIIQVQIIPGCA